MTTNEILDLDYRKKENRVKIQKALRMIPQLSESGDGIIPLRELEKLVGSFCREYEVMIHYICPTYLPGECDMLAASLKRTSDMEWLETVYSMCCYELFAKLSVKLYSDIKKGRYGKRDWDRYKRDKQQAMVRYLEER